MTVLLGRGAPKARGKKTITSSKSQGNTGTAREPD
jgi:hypothetical protein